ncbi:hypothetical protein [Aporhodopirellula aestuarii]|uniref:Uncharacterized protein n=1 Tax=Aporhodopirellula aestuarii TaxID=2950107 RepID=A0ABT0U622_9BACT|nr:hypothetical protein [Aporhodopirellula aestuarii]MCM2372382.1 hypothetical protein [Aporhodopirellula aestuarii]
MATSHSSGKKTTTVAGVAIALLIGGYTLLRPAINDATGWNLPAIAEQDHGGVAQLDAPTAQSTKTTAPQPTSEAKTKPSTTSESKTDSLENQTAQSKPISATSVEPTEADDPSLKYGLLREIGNDRYISPAGLMYTPGSAEGHRLEHLKRHTADQPGRPGKHGVFDGGMEGALKTIDKAYENAKAGKRTTKKTDQDRTIYTVDMGKRVGFVGGREGNQRRKPMARRVQLVLEGNRVITAYPL